MLHQKWVVCNIIIKEASIKRIKETLAEAEVEEILVEEEEDGLYVIIIINPGTCPTIVRIHVQCAHTRENWIIRVGQRKLEPESKPKCTENISQNM
jgi:hypothetical protein